MTLLQQDDSIASEVKKDHTEENTEEEDEEGGEECSDVPAPTVSDALEAIRVVNLFYESRGGSSEIIEKKIMDIELLGRATASLLVKPEIPGTDGCSFYCGIAALRLPCAGMLFPKQSQKVTVLGYSQHLDGVMEYDHWCVVAAQGTNCGGMYSEWASLSALIQNGSEDSQSVLGKFPSTAGKEVALAIVRQLASNLGISQPPEPSPLQTDRDVQWCMEVICFGMSLPLSEHDTIRDCVHVYCEWLSALHPVPKVSVPWPVCEDPNLYAKKMISHFHNLFLPRKGEGTYKTNRNSLVGVDTINRQAVLCHRVLRTLQNLAQASNVLTRDTWEALLLFLLAINDTLLAPPTVKDDIGDHLCERVLSVLFEVWLLACARCFPSPPLWKTFREMCMNWRHRMALIDQWNRVNLALTAKLLEFTYGPDFPELKICESKHE
ncbi:hypothetical protein PR048_002206 [Dryococelus australis]|uniref:Ral GTPase-activating protein subunit alpha/beta N-terminal domain-containing protein n=1 Tax=Dryococelus australis TaxID=614101 RepID=A0ABQ9IL32_9NEOP|nr:hypothetical protein PR048_002206 [Dryococelus australis]